MHGDGICIRFVRDLSSHGPVHAGSLLRERRILLETTLAGDPADFARIFVHELFHFAWLRLGNPRRRSYELLLAEEICRGCQGRTWLVRGMAQDRTRALRPPAAHPPLARICLRELLRFRRVALFRRRAAIQNLRFLRASGQGARTWFERSVATDGISV